VEDEMLGQGATVRPVVADLTTATGIERVVRSVEAEGQGVDALVHCAGVFAFDSVNMPQPAEFDLMFETNVRVPWLLTSALLPALKERKGQVVFVNSSAAFNAGKTWTIYSARKAALRMVADGFRANVNPWGIRVLSVYPGRTATRLQERIHESEARPYDAAVLMQPGDVASLILHALDLPRTAEITDVMMRPATKT